MQLEEGEIESDNESIETFTPIPLDPYTPLERPDFGPLNVIPPREEEVESDKKTSSSEDSDDDPNPKRSRITVNNSVKRKAFNRIWCKDANEHLTDFFCSFGLRNPEHDRNVESYTISTNNKRHRKRKVPKKQSDNSDALSPLHIGELETSELNSFEEVAKDIAAKLYEPNYELILSIVIVIGKDQAIKFYNQTKEIEMDGGVLIANGSRRRTSGGLFINLVRSSDDISKSQKSQIFDAPKIETQARKSIRKKKYQQKKFKDWMLQMGDEKGSESGHEVMNNPPPSPEPLPPQNLPELPLRRDLVLYSNLSVTPPNPGILSELIDGDKSNDENIKSSKHECSPEILSKSSDDVDSMELIYN